MSLAIMNLNVMEWLVILFVGAYVFVILLLLRTPAVRGLFLWLLGISFGMAIILPLKKAVWPWIDGFRADELDMPPPFISLVWILIVPFMYHFVVTHLVPKARRGIREQKNGVTSPKSRIE